MSITLPEPEGGSLGRIEPRRAPRPAATQQGPGTDLRVCLNCGGRVPCRCANSLYWTAPRPTALQEAPAERVRLGRLTRLGNFLLWISASVVVGGACAMGFHLLAGKAYAVPMFFFATIIAFVALRER